MSSHFCKSLLLQCMDFRLGEAIKKWLEENHLMNNCDVVSLAGAVKNLVEPKESTDREFILRQIEISQRLHRISEIILMNHTDCGAYGGREAFESGETEYQRHKADLKTAKEIIQGRFSELEVRMILAKITPLGQVSFEEII